MRRWPNVYHEEYFETAERGAFDLLPGTPVYWTDPCGFGESDYRPAAEELRHLLGDLSIDWARLAKQDEIRYRFERLIREKGAK
jgi:hypothetical protein